MGSVSFLENALKDAKHAKVTAKEKVEEFSEAIGNAQEAKEDRLEQIKELDEEIKEIEDSLKILKREGYSL